MLTTGQKILRARLLFGAWAEPPRDFSQTDLAELLGLTQGSVGHWESDRRDPGADNYKALAKTLGVRLAWLMGNDDGPMYEGDAMRPKVQPPPKPTEPLPDEAGTELLLHKPEARIRDAESRPGNGAGRRRKGHGKKDG